MKTRSLIMLFLPVILLFFGVGTRAAAAPAADLNIGDIPAAILNLLLSPGIQVTQLNIQLSVGSCLTL